MTLTSLAVPAPAESQLGWLLAGFIILVLSLAVLTQRKPKTPLESKQGTARALLYALAFGLTAACFWRVIAGALLGTDRNPLLLALADVIFVTLGIFVWVMVIAENRPLWVVGFRGAPAGRFVLTMIMGMAAVVVYASGPWRELVTGRVQFTPDTLVFALLFASAGSALPAEILFRGYLMSSLNGRVSRWTRVLVPALIFTAIRSLRYAPLGGLPSSDWMYYVFGVVLPLGVWWGVMRDLAGGSLWPGVLSHFLIEFFNTLAGASPVDAFHQSVSN